MQKLNLDVLWSGSEVHHLFMICFSFADLCLTLKDQHMPPSTAQHHVGIAGPRQCLEYCSMHWASPWWIVCSNALDSSLPSSVGWPHEDEISQR